jgi:hypothetical protein
MTTNETPPRVGGYIIQTRNLNWAWGETPEAAIKNVRKMPSERARKGDRVIYRLPVGAVDAWVDQMGSIRWDWADDAPDRNAVGVVTEEPPK